MTSSDGITGFDAHKQKLDKNVLSSDYLGPFPTAHIINQSIEHRIHPNPVLSLIDAFKLVCLSTPQRKKIDFI